MLNADGTVLNTDLDGLECIGRGKVRDLYDLGEHLLIVTTDRLSAFDVVFDRGIPGKGEVLTTLSKFWFDRIGSIVPHHLVTTDVDEMPDVVAPHRDVLRGRTMLTRKCTVFPVECVVRGYIVGSGWKDYNASGGICGIPLPEGRQLADKLPEVIFTPATKAESGHDENIDFATMSSIVGEETASRLKEISFEVFGAGSSYAAERGILLADTKFEFGTDADGNITLIDEVLTPDSSRYWPAEDWNPGQSPPSFDKQIVRDYLETTDWNKEPPAPELPDAIVERTAARYAEILERLTS